MNIYTNPNIDGTVLFALWNTVEPQAGTYDWSSIDTDINNAVAHGKKLSLDMTAGAFTPAWLYAKGVPHTTFYFGAHDEASRCAPIQLPAVWDDTYQHAFTDMMSALAAHLKSIPGAYQAVKIVKATGVNNITPEFHLTAITCAGTSAGILWQQLGYRPDKVVEAWEHMASAIAQMFPDKVLALDVLTGNDFPFLNENGAIVSNGDPTLVDIKAAIVSFALSPASGFSNRFALQWDALNSQGVNNSSKKHSVLLIACFLG